jgi:sigma-B regulation protein RsbU (phosphoserine phosphatase)
VNRALLANLRSCSSTIFATACYVVIDVTTGRVQSANAGHPAPLLVRPAARLAERLNGQEAGHDPALGLMGETRYRTATHVLGARDRLLLFTDGIYEVESNTGQEFGYDRLQEVVQSRITAGNLQLLDELLVEVRSYSGSGEFSDDVCMVSVELAG